MCYTWYFDYLKSVDFFSLACWKLWKLVNFRTFCAKKLFKDFICFICRIRGVHFSELVKGICHLSAVRRQIGRKTAVFWSVQNWIWSVKSQGILFLPEGGHSVKPLIEQLVYKSWSYWHDGAFCFSHIFIHMYSSPTSQPSKQIFFRDPSEESLVWGRTCRTTDVLMDMLYLSWDANFFI